MSDDSDIDFLSDDLPDNVELQEVRQLEIDGINYIMKSRMGRDFIWRNLQKCKVFESMFTVEPIANAYNAGMRSYGVWLKDEVKGSSPDLYLRMLEENINE